MKINKLIIVLSYITLYGLYSCKKEIQVPPPVNAIVTSEVFKDSVDANAAILGLYTQMAVTGSNISFMNGALSVYTGSSADELTPVGNDFGNFVPFYSNTLISVNSYIENLYWTPAYQNIYMSNACINGLQGSTGISATEKSQLIGEAQFARALNYFYLVNLFGDVPLETSINYKTNESLPRTPTAQVYAAIVSDLQNAQNELKSDYSISGGQRIRANKWAASALLAKVYLYQKNYQAAIDQCTSVINNTSLFSLVPDLNKVFFINSSETILQWNLNASVSLYNATSEGFFLIPRGFPGPSSNMYPVKYAIAPQLINAFEPGDQRKIDWINSATDYLGDFNYFPFKYKIGPNQTVVKGTATEYYTVLRLAEQYLIRAEANANLNHLAPAISDLNTIRNRAGLPNLSPTLDQTQVLAAVAQERRVELFCEWSNRWLDLKRTGQINAVMSVVTQQKNSGSGVQWQSYQQLYPIPQAELLLNPNLKQNPGY